MKIKKEIKEKIKKDSLSKETIKLQKFIQKNPTINHYDIFSIKKTYQELIDCITEHNHLYYIKNKPIISDQERDQLFTYIKKIEEYFPHIISKNSPTQELIWQISEGFKQANHKVRLISLENSYNAEDIKHRWEKIKKEITKITKHHIDNIDKINKENKKNTTYIIEPKFDGIGIELIYKNWEFTQAISRGDWQTWEDITTNVQTISNIPKKLKNRKKDNIYQLSVRGEIIMPKSQRKKINKKRESEWKNTFANTRNATAWSIKLLDQNEVKKRWLMCFIYDVIYTNKETTLPQQHDQLINKLDNYWLPIFQRSDKKNNITDIIKICNQETKQKLNSFDFDFDGLVIKINDIKLREQIGTTVHHPKRAIAYKFPAEQISTQIQSIDFQIWRTGIITPVANLKPVQLSWVTIKRVSLHNFDFIKNKDIHLHDFVRLQRSGEVIPYITWVIKQNRTHDFSKNINKYKIIAPTKCPSCKQNITKKDMHFYCKNENCPAKIKEKINHFVSKNCMNIEGIWDSIINILVEIKIIKNYADLYKIINPNTKLKIQSVPWFGNKKLFEISQQLEASKKKPLRRIINALWISGIGKRNAQQIEIKLKKETQNFQYKDFYLKITNEDFLNEIDGIWEKIILNIKDYFIKNKELLNKLNKIWINFSPNNNKDKTDKKNQKYINQHFWITGSFPIARTNIIKLLEDQGAIFDTNPTKKTNFMLIWDKAWNKKQKAEKLKVTCHTWRENIIKRFPEIKKLSNQKIETNLKTKKPKMQSLF